MTPEEVKELVEKNAFFLKEWAKDLKLEDIKAAVVAKAPELKADIQANAKAASLLALCIKQTEAVRTAAGKTAAMHQSAQQALQESYGVQKLKEGFATVLQSDVFKMAAESCAGLMQKVQAKAEEVVPKAHTLFKVALEKAHKARLAIVEYIEATQKEK